MTLLLGGVILALGLGWVLFTYNRLIGLRNNVLKAWTDIDVLLRQRHDELPQLVRVCEGHMEYERSLLTRVIEARDLTRGARASEPLQAAEAEVSSAVRSLLAVSERYPNLKADQSLLRLQQRITTLEDLIADRREFYNACVTLYNTGIEMAPDTMVARALAFRRRPLWRVVPAQDLRA